MAGAASQGAQLPGSSEPPAGLDVRSVTVRFGPTTAVDDVSLALQPGRVLAVLGPSGCGKSTLLRAVAGLEELAGGSIHFAGQDLAGVPTHRRGFAMMFQDGQLFQHLDVAGNIGYPLSLKGIRGSARDEEVSRLLSLVDLQGYAVRRPATLSGGEQQRVALARALAARPRLLLLDEPLSALDRSLRERLAADVRHALTTTHTTAILVTHDHDEAFAIADDLAVMRAGRLIQHGTVPEVFRRPADAQTAQFLGYPTVLDPEAAERLTAYLSEPVRGQAVALRREALRAAPIAERDYRQGLVGTVERVSAARDGWHLEVLVPGIGRLPAIATVDVATRVGDPVALQVERSDVVVLGEGGGA
ncbi:MAG TPA: ABC transporter ATP-binding protein [Dermatophilaceae bacterium]|jgi:thiamine transport system ATP-binding protein|nr:ABC transporter ATP-binding protein [Actinomycetales bacterium]HMT31095.1 ABC transporter ATP-binding protein [Dermatophilaceae bacterium]HMT88086.1 ABC transporter ATP-binding protein [Dermatophilaceae bacterium]